jgi:hypothetical protein
MILFGLVLGRWWKSSLIAATLCWPALALADDAIDSASEVFVAAVLGVANAGAGVLVRQAILHAYRRWSMG